MKELTDFVKVLSGVKPYGLLELARSLLEEGEQLDSASPIHAIRHLRDEHLIDTSGMAWFYPKDSHFGKPIFLFEFISHRIIDKLRKDNSEAIRSLHTLAKEFEAYVNYDITVLS